jgi:hypothetical protein
LKRKVSRTEEKNKEEEPTLFVAGNRTLEGGDVWYMDSGSNSRVCFLNYKEILAAGDVSELQVAREGNMAVYQKDGRLLSTWKGVRDNNLEEE